jgi:hypothetical protein
MTNLFSYDDLGVLTESLGRVPDDALLFDLVETAREVAGERYNRACISHDRDMESWRAGMETHTLRMAQWSRAVEQHAAAMRDHAVTLEGWGLDPTLYPKPVPPEGPGPAPQYGEPPVAPVAPTDADAVAMLMAEQRAAVARARLEPKWEPVINMEIERAEIVNEAFDLVMSALKAKPALEPEPPLLPAPDALMSDWGEVGAGTDDITGDMLLDAFEHDETETVAVVQTLSALRLKHLSEQLNVERARLDREHQATGVANPRSASIDRLLGLLTRRGEV